MYLSYLLGGRVDTDELKVFVNEKEASSQDWKSSVGIWRQRESDTAMQWS